MLFLFTKQQHPSIKQLHNYMLPKAMVTSTLDYQAMSLIWPHKQTVSMTCMYADGSHVVRVFSGVYVFVHLSVGFFYTLSQKPMQLKSSTNLTQTRSTISSGNAFILGSKVKITRHKKTSRCRSSDGMLY